MKTAKTTEGNLWEGAVSKRKHKPGDQPEKVAPNPSEGRAHAVSDIRAHGVFSGGMFFS